MREQRIKVVYKVPGKKAQLIEVKNELKNLQELVQGYIEVVRISCPGGNEPIIIVCNEEGKLKNLEDNVYCYELVDMFVGNIFAVNCDKEGNFVSLTPNQILYAIHYFDVNAVESIAIEVLLREVISK